MPRTAEDVETTLLGLNRQFETQAEGLCEPANADGATEELASLLPKLRTTFQAWREVWPRMGSRREFRQAVAREAGLWSRRLTALAKPA